MAVVYGQGHSRHYNGRFYLFFGTPDEGYFMTSASRAGGPWEPLTPLLPEPGWDDCTAMWDENGKAYFVGTLLPTDIRLIFLRCLRMGKALIGNLRNSLIQVVAGKPVS